MLLPVSTTRKSTHLWGTFLCLLYMYPVKRLSVRSHTHGACSLPNNVVICLSSWLGMAALSISSSYSSLTPKGVYILTLGSGPWLWRWGEDSEFPMVVGVWGVVGWRLEVESGVVVLALVYLLCISLPRSTGCEPRTSFLALQPQTQPTILPNKVSSVLFR